jgi:hypothetical protein
MNSKSVSLVLVTLESLDGTVMSSQVLERSRQLRKCGIDVRVISLCMTRKSWFASLRIASSENSRAGCLSTVAAPAIRSSVPGSIAVNSLIVLLMILCFAPQAELIHARADSAAATSRFTARLVRIPLLWDARGDALAEVSSPKPSDGICERLIYPFRMAAARQHRSLALRTADAAIVVSSALRARVLAARPSLPSTVIPCGAPATLFYFDQSIREATRRRLGIAHNEVLLAFSGSMAPWQCVGETLRLMTQAVEIAPSTRCLIISPDANKIAALAGETLRSRLISLSCEFNEVPQYLHASDFGFVIREPSRINDVASPIKFAEFSLSGLKVITSKAVLQIAELASSLQNVVDPSDLNTYVIRGVPPLSDRVRTAAVAKVLLSQEVQNLTYLSAYTALLHAHSRHD